MEIKTEVEICYRTGLIIPMHAYMSEATADKIIEAIVNDFSFIMIKSELDD